jgi:lipoprotein-releasing system permease protein
MNTLALLLSSRFAFSGGGALPLVTRAAIGGLALGCAVLIVVLSVLNGFERALAERVLAVLPQVVVWVRDDTGTLDVARLGTMPGVAGIAPHASASVLAAGPATVRAATVYGIDPAHEGDVSILDEFLPAPGYGALRPGGFGALLGARLAGELGIRKGDQVTIVLPEAMVTPLGVFPRQRAFRVVGLFDSGAELDGRAIYVHLADARRLLRDGAAAGYRLRIDDLFAAPVIGDRIRVAFGAAVGVQDWTRTHGNLYHAIVTQKAIMLIVLSLVVAVAAFNVVSGLVMVVARREADIAILRTLGVSARGITGVFLLQGSALGTIGIATGIVCGVAIALLAPAAFAALEAVLGTQLLQQYFVRYLPSDVRTGDLVVVAGIAFALTAAAAVVPARRAARVQPAEVLRHE